MILSEKQQQLELIRMLKRIRLFKTIVDCKCPSSWPINYSKCLNSFFAFPQVPMECVDQFINFLSQV